jgi:hypothetical protein
MLFRYRRYWAPAAAILLAVPLLVTLFGRGGRTVSADEARQLAPAPSLGDGLAGWTSLPRQTDAYLRDHFGLRPMFLHAYSEIMSGDPFHTGNGLVLTGSDGWMFLRANFMVQQSAGTLRRDDRVAGTAEFLEAMKIELAAEGARLLVAPPPNSATLYPEELPLWARNRGLRTEYDVFMDDLAARGVATVDLRPALRAARADGKIYHKHDTHWTARGAVAAFNAIVRADAKPDWTLDPSAVLGPSRAVEGGDLTRMLGVGTEVTEADQALTLAGGKLDTLVDGLFSTFVETSDRSGPTIMVIGDSFTAGFFPPMLSQHTGKVIWVHHQFCKFDWKWIDQFHPAEVWWMPTERYFLCDPGARPTGMPPRRTAGR